MYSNSNIYCPLGLVAGGAEGGSAAARATRSGWAASTSASTAGPAGRVHGTVTGAWQWFLGGGGDDTTEARAAAAAMGRGGWATEQRAAVGPGPGRVSTAASGSVVLADKAARDDAERARLSAAARSGDGDGGRMERGATRVQCGHCGILGVPGHVFAPGPHHGRRCPQFAWNSLAAPAPTQPCPATAPPPTSTVAARA